MIVDNLLSGPAGVHYSQSAPQTDEETIEGLDRFLFVGVFKRGPFYKPIKVTEKTLPGILGKDYKNPYYIALQDAFETGAAEIWVMRVESTEAGYIEPPYSAWIISPTVTVQNGTARYTAYKKNISDQYDSFAEINLSTAVTRSLHDSDMQQWQAVNDATFATDPAVLSYSIDAEESVFNIRRQATGVTTDDIINVIVSRYNTSPLNFVGKDLFQALMILSGWTIEDTGKVTKKPNDGDNPFYITPAHQYYYQNNYTNSVFNNPLSAAEQEAEITGQLPCFHLQTEGWIYYYDCKGSVIRGFRYNNPAYDPSYNVEKYPVLETEMIEKIRDYFENPQTNADLINSAFEYDPIAGANNLYQKTVLTKSFADIAQQIISNTSSSNQAISLLAEAYLENVAKSIFVVDASKQFIRHEDLTAIFEANKVLKE